MVGRDLIAASQVRAQISQIEKIQTGVNIFKVKYNSLPGDIPNEVALQFGFDARSSSAVQINGNGILETGTINDTTPTLRGELLLFWHDLSNAKLIEGNYTSGNYAAVPATAVSGSSLERYIPSAKMGKNNYISVWSGGWKMPCSGQSDGINYFQLAVQWYSPLSAYLNQDVSITASEAYAIDKKIDDGLPQFGKILALMPNIGMTQGWAASGTSDPAWGQLNSGIFSSTSYCAPVSTSSGDTSAASASDTTCYDNNNVAGAVAKYSITWKNGRMPNCALAFKFQ